MEGRAAEIQSLHPTYAKEEGTRERLSMQQEVRRAESWSSEKTKSTHMAVVWAGTEGGGEPSAVWSSCVAHTARKEDTDSMVSQRMPIRKVRKSEQIHVKT